MEETKVADEEKPVGIRIKKYENRTLPVELSQDELLECGRKLVDCRKDIARVETVLAGQKAEAKAAIGTLDAEVGRFAGMIDTGAEDREVAVRHVIDFDADRYFVIREDTDERISEAPIPPREYQMDLGVDQAAAEEEWTEFPKCGGCEKKDATIKTNEGVFLCQGCAAELGEKIDGTQTDLPPAEEATE